MTLRALAIVFALALSVVTADAEGPPAFPNPATNIQQCQEYGAAYGAYIKGLQAALQDCLKSVKASDWLNPVRPRCSGVGYPKLCANQAEAADCAVDDKLVRMQECRANVRVFQNGQGSAADDLPEDPFNTDYRDAIIAKYEALALPPPKGPSLDDFLPEDVKTFKTWVTRAKQARDAYANPTPQNVLSLGQDLAKWAYGKTTKFDLAKSLFETGSKAASETGATAINDAIAALHDFDRVEPQSLTGITIAGANPAPPPPRNTGGGGGGGSGGYNTPPSNMCSGGVPNGAFICGNDGYLHPCQCSGGSCRILNIDTAGCNRPGAIVR